MLVDQSYRINRTDTTYRTDRAWDLGQIKNRGAREARRFLVQ